MDRVEGLGWRARWATVVLSAAMAVSALGCGEPDVTGSWFGSWHSGIFNGDVSLDLEQDEANAVVGSFNVGSSFCVPNGDVEATVEGHEIHGALVSDAGRVELEGRISAAGDRIEATFEVTSGACAGTTGDFRVDR
jgi:hypothetical protein